MKKELLISHRYSLCYD